MYLLFQRVNVQPGCFAVQSFSAGYVWAYNTQPYFESVGQTAKQIGTYMSWVPLVGGSIGVILGGKVSDFLMKRLGLFARVLVLTVSQVR